MNRSLLAALAVVAASAVAVGVVVGDDDVASPAVRCEPVEIPVPIRAPETICR